MSAQVLAFPERRRANDPSRTVTVLCSLHDLSVEEFASALKAAGFRCSLSGDRLLGDQMVIEPTEAR